MTFPSYGIHALKQYVVSGVFPWCSVGGSAEYISLVPHPTDLEICVFGKVWVFRLFHSLYVCIYPDDSGSLPLQLFIIINRHIRILSLKSHTLLVVCFFQLTFSYSCLYITVAHFRTKPTNRLELL